MKKSIVKICLALTAAAGVAAFALAPGEAEAGSAYLLCESLGGYPGAYICDALPDSSANTYAWSASGGVYLKAAPPGSATRQVQCKVGASGGSVSVKITYPDGTQDTVSQGLNCGGGVL